MTSRINPAQLKQFVANKAAAEKWARREGTPLNVLHGGKVGTRMPAYRKVPKALIKRTRGRRRLIPYAVGNGSDAKFLGLGTWKGEPVFVMAAHRNAAVRWAKAGYSSELIGYTDPPYTGVPRAVWVMYRYRDESRLEEVMSVQEAREPLLTIHNAAEVQRRLVKYLKAGSKPKNWTAIAPKLLSTWSRNNTIVGLVSKVDKIKTKKGMAMPGLAMSPHIRLTRGEGVELSEKVYRERRGLPVALRNMEKVLVEVPLALSYRDLQKDMRGGGARFRSLGAPPDDDQYLGASADEYQATLAQEMDIAVRRRSKHKAGLVSMDWGSKKAVFTFWARDDDRHLLKTIERAMQIALNELRAASLWNYPGMRVLIPKRVRVGRARFDPKGW